METSIEKDLVNHIINNNEKAANVVFQTLIDKKMAAAKDARKAAITSKIYDSPTTKED